MDETIKQLINEGLKTSPGEGNGYGLLLAVLMGLLAIIVGAVFWFVKEVWSWYKEQKQIEIKERAEQAARIEAAIAEHARESRERYDLHGNQINAHGERLARIEAILPQK